MIDLLWLKTTARFGEGCAAHRCARLAWAVMLARLIVR
jgi:hypothetical protein